MMTWPWAALLLLVGFLLLYLGAEALVRGSSALAIRLGATPLVVGLTVVAFGTSSPELVVSLKAAMIGNGGIAIGNVVGSNIINIAIVLGLSALLRPLDVEAEVLRLDLPVLIAASLLLDLFLLNGRLTFLDGLVFIAGILLYISLRAAKALSRSTPLTKAVLEEKAASSGMALAGQLVMIGAGFGLLAFGAKFMVEGAVTLAKLSGCSETVIALTVIAGGTSLPELAASTVASLRKVPGIAVGNVVGSCIFNILAVLGASVLVAPLSATGITFTDLGVMTLLTLVLVPILGKGLRVSRWEGGLLLVAYALYLAWLLG